MMSHSQGTFIEINLKSLENNFNYIKSIISKKTKILAVVKACAYGSDPLKISKFLEKLNVDYFAVAYVYEAIKIREAGVKKPILIFHPQPNNFIDIIKYGLTPTLYSFRILNLFKASLKEKSIQNYPIHLKINTGLNRVGFDLKEIPELITSINNDNFIMVEGIYSHLSASEDSLEEEFSLEQIHVFKQAFNKIINRIKNRPLIHICNTSGIINFPDAHFDMVRSGIGMYGFTNKLAGDENLIPVLSLKSIISQIHDIKKGDAVGYNRDYIAEENKKIGTIPLGHADGISRAYGNKTGFVYVDDKKAFIIGNVCMDMLMVDLSNIDCKEGDEVVIFNEKYTAEKLAESANTISYELLTALSQRIKRNFID